MRLGLACLVSLALIALAGCSGSSNGLPVYTGGSELPPSDPAYATTVQIRYLGAGGVVIKRGDDVLLTAPFFSNPSIPRVAFGEIRSLPRAGRPLREAGRQLPRGRDRDPRRAFPLRSPDGRVVHQVDVHAEREDLRQHDDAVHPGGRSDRESRRCHSVEPFMGDRRIMAGKWFYASPRLRFMALKSDARADNFRHQLLRGQL